MLHIFELFSLPLWLSRGEALSWSAGSHGAGMSCRFFFRDGLSKAVPRQLGSVSRGSFSRQEKAQRWAMGDMELDMTWMWVLFVGAEKNLGAFCRS